MDNKGLDCLLNFKLMDAILGRRSRRFSLGAELVDGPLVFKSKKEPLPLSELEQLIVLLTTGGNTGWHNLIKRNPHYAPKLPNYSNAAGGRVFPSAAGIHTSEFFFTNDNGVFFFPTRDAANLIVTDDQSKIDLMAYLENHQERIQKLSDRRLYIPNREPYMEGHNTWCVNRPGSLLIIPVADIAQHFLTVLCFLLQNGYAIYDDINSREIPHLRKYAALYDIENTVPLTYAEQYALTESTAELSAACFSGMLVLQGMGLGGWQFDGIDRHVILGASQDPKVSGLGFRYEEDPRWPLPNITGLPGIFEGFCPPHYPNMRAAVNALVRRKFGEGGPFHENTPGNWKNTSEVRSAASKMSDEFVAAVSHMAQYVYDTFGKFPGTVPSIFCLTYLQAHHLDLDFYDKYYKSGAYLETHAKHFDLWHSG